ncbi:MAG: hypothetical protein ABL933_19320 [Methyloglobulus sp.]|nr:hypothetical protein [Methyloglobulus sp.]
MIKAYCRYLDLSELTEIMDVSVYQEFVSPINYDFGLTRDTKHLVIGIVERKGTLWLYSTAEDSSKELNCIPAVLFAIERAKIPVGMTVSLINTERSSLEILPESLACIEGWFERYVDEDEEIVKIVESEFARFLLQG